MVVIITDKSDQLDNDKQEKITRLNWSTHRFHFQDQEYMHLQRIKVLKRLRDREKKTKIQKTVEERLMKHLIFGIFVAYK